jgi:hypothetical protein
MKYNNNFWKLEEIVFLNNREMEIFKIWLDKMDYIEAVFCSEKETWRNSFELIKNNDINNYILKISKTIQKKEIYNLIKYLEKKFNLNFYKELEHLQDKIKLLVSIAINNWELNEIDIKETVKEKWIDINSQEYGEVKNRELNKRKLLEYFHTRWVKYWELKNKSPEEIIDIILSELEIWLYSIFFTRAKDALSKNFKTMTLDEIDKQHLKSIEISEKKINWESIIHNKNPEWNLRNSIWIEKYKKLLDEARLNNDINKIQSLELEVLDKIISYLRSYPRTEENWHWSFPKEIRETKMLHCTWYSILWHIFLEELWIEHYWIKMVTNYDNFTFWHIALGVKINNNNYFLDATLDNKSHILKIKKNKKWQRFIKLYNKDNWNNNYRVFKEIKYFEISILEAKAGLINIILLNININKKIDIKLSEKNLKYFNSSENYIHLVNVLIKYNYNKNEIINLLEQAINLYPNNKTIYMLLGDNYN